MTHEAEEGFHHPRYRHGIAACAIGTAGFSGLVKGNKTLGAILELLKKDTSEKEIVAAMKARYDASEEIIARDVKKALAELRKIGALEE